MISKTDIEKLIAAKTFTTNPEWPDYNSDGIKYKLYADGFREVWMLKTGIALTATATQYNYTFPTEVFNGNTPDNVQLELWHLTNDARGVYAKVVGRPANNLSVKVWLSTGTDTGFLFVYASGYTL